MRSPPMHTGASGHGAPSVGESVNPRCGQLPPVGDHGPAQRDGLHGWSLQQRHHCRKIRQGQVVVDPEQPPFEVFGMVRSALSSAISRSTSSSATTRIAPPSRQEHVVAASPESMARMVRSAHSLAVTKAERQVGARDGEFDLSCHGFPLQGPPRVRRQREDNSPKDQAWLSKNDPLDRLRRVNLEQV